MHHVSAGFTRKVIKITKKPVKGSTVAVFGVGLQKKKMAKLKYVMLKCSKLAVS